METNPKELAAQLRKPEGEFGVKVAEHLNNTNKYITSNCYDFIPFRPNHSILEIGPGNGVLMQDLLKREPSLILHGVDFSQDMVTEAIHRNKGFITNGSMKFETAGVSSLPYNDNFFDHSCTINTLYFWPTPIDDAKEILRVLKPGGSLTIAIRPKNEMKKLEVTQFGFEFYNENDAKKLLLDAGFEHVEHIIESDPPIEFEGKTLILNSLIIRAYK